MARRIEVRRSQMLVAPFVLCIQAVGVHPQLARCARVVDLQPPLEPIEAVSDLGKPPMVWTRKVIRPAREPNPCRESRRGWDGFVEHWGIMMRPSVVAVIRFASRALAPLVCTIRVKMTTGTNRCITHKRAHRQSD